MGIPNENFPPVIIAGVGKFDVSRIFIDGGNSCDIIYSELFEKMNLNLSSLFPYEGSYLQAFNWATIRPWGYAELIVFVDSGEDILAIDS